MGKNILVVDDMQAQRDLMSNYLSRAGYNVTTAESGARSPCNGQNQQTRHCCHRFSHA